LVILQSSKNSCTPCCFPSLPGEGHISDVWQEQILSRVCCGLHLAHFSHWRRRSLFVWRRCFGRRGQPTAVDCRVRLLQSPHPRCCVGSFFLRGAAARACPCRVRAAQSALGGLTAGWADRRPKVAIVSGVCTAFTDAHCIP
jgi:hypothetical protein